MVDWQQCGRPIARNFTIVGSLAVVYSSATLFQTQSQFSLSLTGVDRRCKVWKSQWCMGRLFRFWVGIAFVLGAVISVPVNETSWDGMSDKLLTWSVCVQCKKDDHLSSLRTESISSLESLWTRVFEPTLGVLVYGLHNPVISHFWKLSRVFLVSVFLPLIQSSLTLFWTAEVVEWYCFVTPDICALVQHCFTLVLLSFWRLSLEFGSATSWRPDKIYSKQSLYPPFNFGRTGPNVL